MSLVRGLMLLGLFSACVSVGPAAEKIELDARSNSWPQWRGPDRDGLVKGPKWPDRITEKNLQLVWRIPLEPSYSGPIVSQDLVFTTETRNKEIEVVSALDRKTGKVVWQTEWSGSMTVPFFAAANGSWIRSTPAFDGERLYVAGIRDVLVCLDAKKGKKLWQIDFVKEHKSPVPAFGFVCSPLVDRDFVFVQAGAAVVKINKLTGQIIWKALKDDGGMNGSAFSSPIITELLGKRQLIVQTREKLAGLDLDTGSVLWSRAVPAFRGMNILTPVVFEDAIFTSTYQNKSWLYGITSVNNILTVKERWTANVAGYMSSPVVIDGHAYLHLQNQRLVCLDLKTGQQKWTSEAFGKYWSMVAQGDRILALDQRGMLMLIRATPTEFDLIDSRKISSAETWAHIAICGEEIFVRELNAMTVYRWK